MSLWSDYIQELRGDRMFLEYPDCFVSYSLPAYAPECIIIHDMYVIPELRKSGRAKALLADVEAVGRKAGCAAVVCELEISTKTFPVAFASQIAVGFMPIGTRNDIIVMRKAIEILGGDYG